MTYRPIPRYGVREIAPGIRANGCWRDPTRPHDEGHNAVCVCQCAWCVEERAAMDAGPVQRDLFGDAIDSAKPAYCAVHKSV